MLAVKFRMLLLAPIVLAVAITAWGSVIILREEIFIRISKGLGFQLEEIILRGNERVQQETLLDALALDHGEALPLINLVDTKARLESLEWVESASLRRVFPDTIEVRVHEQQPFAFWQKDGQLFLVNSDGDAFLDFGPADSPRAGWAEFVEASLPYLVGAGALEAGVALVEALDDYPAIKEKMKAAVRVGQRRWDIHFDGGVRVQMPEKSLHQAMVQLHRLHLEHDILRRDVRIVDLRIRDRIGFALSEGAAMPEAFESIVPPSAASIIPLRPKTREDG